MRFHQPLDENRYSKGTDCRYDRIREADVSAASAIMLCSGQGRQGLVLTYLKRTTGYSRQQGTRLVSKYHYTGIRKD